MGYSVAIDGPAGAGKSTIAKQIARKLNFIYVDTGAMYRAMAYYLLQNHVDASDTVAIDAKCREADICIRYENKEQQVWLNGENVNGVIRTEEVGNMASASSVNPNVRAKLVELQRKMAETDNVIMDGRDIGTTVLPNADVKIYLTAGSHVRALRRYEELKAAGTACDLETIERDIIERDKRDMNRELSPLRRAEDALLVDSSDMTVEEVLKTIEEVIREDRSRKGMQ